MHTVLKFLQAYLIYGAGISCLLLLAFITSAFLRDGFKMIKRARGFSNKLTMVISMLAAVVFCTALSIASLSCFGWLCIKACTLVQSWRSI